MRCESLERHAAAEMSSFDVAATAFQRGAGGGAPGAAAPGGVGAGAGSSPSGSLPQSPIKVMRFTVNPLTKSVTAKLL